MSVIHTFAGETVTFEWRESDRSKQVLIGEIDEVCAVQTAAQIKADPLLQHEADSVQSDPVVSRFTLCMESHGLQGELKDVALPTTFLFGLLQKNVATWFAAKSSGVTLARFKEDVNTCALPFLQRERSLVHDHRYRTIPIGEQGYFSVESSFKTIAPGSVALKTCMEQFGYAVEDRTRY